MVLPSLQSLLGSFPTVRSSMEWSRLDLSRRRKAGPQWRSLRLDPKQKGHRLDPSGRGWGPTVGQRTSLYCGQSIPSPLLLHSSHTAVMSSDSSIGSSLRPSNQGLTLSLMCHIPLFFTLIGSSSALLAYRLLSRSHLCLPHYGLTSASLPYSVVSLPCFGPSLSLLSSNLTPIHLGLGSVPPTGNSLTSSWV